MNYSYDSDDNIVMWKDTTLDAFDFFTTENLISNVLNEDSESRFNIILESLLASDSDELMFICNLMNAYATLIDPPAVKKLQRELFKIQNKWKMRYQQGCKQISQKLGPVLVQKNKKQTKAKGISARQVTAIKPASGFINLKKGYHLPSVPQPLNGPGKLTLQNGFELEGIFQNNILNGLGKAVHPNGTKFIGSFENNAPKGDGILIIDGNVVTGVFDGFDCNKIKDVIVKYTDGSIYSGETKDCKITGKGQLKFAEGSIVIGDFVDGFVNGDGEIKNNGYYYRGRIRNNHSNGIGLLTLPNKDQLFGYFKNEEIQGIAYLISADENYRYYGEFHNLQPKGRGIVIFRNGNWIQGTVINLNMNGHCIGYCEEYIYDGEMKDNEPNGRGTIYYRDGRILVGDFEKGQLIQQQKQKSSIVANCNSQSVRDLLKFYRDILETNDGNIIALEYLNISMGWLKLQLNTGIYKNCFEFQQILIGLQSLKIDSDL